MTKIYFENFILSEQKKWLGENKGYYRKCSCLVPVVINYKQASNVSTRWRQAKQGWKYRTTEDGQS